ncbi:MAG TPA: GDSL-type esterase/lipase family protein [Actinomycetota bacterium]|nr:GDSL-type esterase/lipase family protein [Actinomycetota bacterium]
MVLAAACSGGGDFDTGERVNESAFADFGITPDPDTDLADGSRVLFFGDSITAGGVQEGGYVRVVEEALEEFYPDRDIDVAGSGVVGDNVGDLRRRVKRDVLDRRPTHVVIFIGVNDVASLGPGSAAAADGERRYAEGLTDLATRISATGASVTICTPGLLGEDLQDGSRDNDLLERYAAAARRVASELGTGLCDVRGDFSSYLAANNPGGEDEGILTVDGIHLTPRGHRQLARTMVRALLAAPAPTASIPPPPSPTASPRPTVRSTRTTRPATRTAAPPPAATSPPEQAPAADPVPSPAPSPDDEPTVAPTDDSPVVDSDDNPTPVDTDEDPTPVEPEDSPPPSP